MNKWSPLSALEMACWVTGILLIMLFFGARVGGEMERKQGIASFAQARAAVNSNEDVLIAGNVSDSLAPKGTRPRTPNGIPDAPQLTPTPADPHGDLASGAVDPSSSLPVALLRIPKVRLEVPVYPDTSERNLNRGAGWIEGTALPNSSGNFAVAAHRDSHFRALKDVVVGDVLELESLTKQRSYQVTHISIVEPEDISPLAAADDATVTLVTCYPFYFIGNAPQRYIVRAIAMK